MSYAVRKDGLGWRAVDSAADCAADEKWQEQQPQPVVSAPTIAPVTPRQIRLALTQLNLRSAVEAAVAAADQTTKDAWQYATEFVRTDPLVATLAAQLGVTSDQLDALWKLAGTL